MIILFYLGSDSEASLLLEADLCFFYLDLSPWATLTITKSTSLSWTMQRVWSLSRYVFCFSFPINLSYHCKFVRAVCGRKIHTDLHWPYCGFLVLSVASRLFFTYFFDWLMLLSALVTQWPQMWNVQVLGSVFLKVFTVVSLVISPFPTCLGALWWVHPHVWEAVPTVSMEGSGGKWTFSPFSSVGLYPQTS